MAVALKIIHSAASDAAAQELFAALAPAHAAHAVILLVTPDLDADPQKNTLVQLALAAHAEGRLVVVTAGGAEAPLGLRDVQKHAWTSADKDAAGIVALLKAVRGQKGTPARRSRSWLWVLAGLAIFVSAVTALTVLGSRSIFAPAPSAMQEDMRAELLQLLSEGQLTPEQAIALAQVLESGAIGEAQSTTPTDAAAAHAAYNQAAPALMTHPDAAVRMAIVQLSTPAARRGHCGTAHLRTEPP